MSDTLGIVVAHADVAHALVRAVEAISGVRGALVPVSNTGCGPQALLDRVRGAAGEGPVLFFVDMPSGSCALATRLASGRRGGCAVITGVSLPMLLDFVFHREMRLEELARRLVAKGREATTLDLPGEPARADQAVQN